MARIAQIVGQAAYLQRIDGAKAYVRFRTGLPQQLPHVQLVLAGDDGFRRGAGQAAALGDQCGSQRALELVVRQHRAPAMAAGGRGLQVGKAVEVEARHTELAEQPAGVEAAPVELQAGTLEARMRERVVVLVEQQADAAGRGRRAIAQAWLSRLRSGW